MPEVSRQAYRTNERKLTVPAKGAGRKMVRDAGGVAKGSSITPGSIVDSEYTLAKPMIEKCNSRDVLKKALTLSRHFSKKEEHMRHILRRLEQVH